MINLNPLADRSTASGNAARGDIASRASTDQTHPQRGSDNLGDAAAGGHRLRQLLQSGRVCLADRLGGSATPPYESRPTVGGDDRQIHQTGKRRPPCLFSLNARDRPRLISDGSARKR